MAERDRYCTPIFTLLRQKAPRLAVGMNARRVLRSFSEGGLKATESSAILFRMPRPPEGDRGETSLQGFGKYAKWLCVK
jgi:hypothetical protein